MTVLAHPDFARRLPPHTQACLEFVGDAMQCNAVAVKDAEAVGRLAPDQPLHSMARGLTGLSADRKVKLEAKLHCEMGYFVCSFLPI